jgi:hypothetical protein
MPMRLQESIRSSFSKSGSAIIQSLELSKIWDNQGIGERILEELRRLGAFCWNGSPSTVVRATQRCLYIKVAV